MFGRFFTVFNSLTSAATQVMLSMAFSFVMNVALSLAKLTGKRITAFEWQSLIFFVQTYEVLFTTLIYLVIQPFGVSFFALLTLQVCCV